jgi:hypothetical protein
LAEGRLWLSLAIKAEANTTAVGINNDMPENEVNFGITQTRNQEKDKNSI